MISLYKMCFNPLIYDSKNYLFKINNNNKRSSLTCLFRFLSSTSWAFSSFSCFFLAAAWALESLVSLAHFLFRVFPSCVKFFSSFVSWLIWSKCFHITSHASHYLGTLLKLQNIQDNKTSKKTKRNSYSVLVQKVDPNIIVFIMFSTDT